MRKESSSTGWLLTTLTRGSLIGLFTVIGSIFWLVVPAQAVALPMCDITLVTLGGSDADDCLGYYDKPNGAAEELGLINDNTTGADWTTVYKIEAGKPSGEITVQGIKLSFLSADLGCGAGTVNNPCEWSIGWEDTNGNDALNLPVTLDIGASFKVSGGIAYFLFYEELLTDEAGSPDTRDGTFTLQLENSGNGSIQGLSHSTLFIRNLEGDDGSGPPQEIPEPGTLLLLGLGLLGLRFRGRA